MAKKRDRESSNESLDTEVSLPVSDAEIILEVEPEIIEAKPEPEPELKLEEKPTDPSDLMALRVYATIAGPKWDQLAGFVSWARRMKIGPLSMAGWTEQYESFKNRPVG